MIEILSVIFQLFIFLVIFSYPLNIYNYKYLKFSINPNLFLIYSLNILIHSSIYLLISFFTFNLILFYYLELLLFVLFILFYRKQILNFIKKINFENLRFFLFFIITCVVFFVSIAETTKLEWDGVSHWIYKAKIFFNDGNFFDFKSNIPYPYYPQLGTFIWGYFWKNSILEYEYFGRLIFPFIYLISLFTVISSIKSNKNFISKILILLFLIVISSDFYLFGGYQEYLLFFLFTILGIITLEHFSVKKKLTSSIIIILILNLIIWSKQEGVFYAIIFGIIIALFNFKNLKISIFFIFSISILCFLHIYLKSFVIDENLFNEKIIHSGLLKYLEIEILIKDLSLIFKHIFISAFTYPIIIFVIVLLLIFYRSLNNKSDYFFYCIFLSNLIFITSIYLQTCANLEDLLPVTIDRILIQTSGFYLAYIFQKINYEFKL